MVKISDAEFEVMQVFWNKKIANSFDIIDALKDKNWSDNTIRTLIKRLQAKKAIGIVKQEGKIYFYEPLIDEEVYKIKESNNFINKLYNGSINEMLLCFAKENKLSKKDLEDLIKKIEDED